MTRRAWPLLALAPIAAVVTLSVIRHRRARRTTYRPMVYVEPGTGYIECATFDHRARTIKLHRRGLLADVDVADDVTVICEPGSQARFERTDRTDGHATDIWIGGAA